jgi:hypothetical protein
VEIEFTEHATIAIQERKITLRWINQALEHPELRIEDPNDPTVERFYRKVPEFGNRVNRVVVNTKCWSWRVVSVFFR